MKRISLKTTVKLIIGAVFLICTSSIQAHPPTDKTILVHITDEQGKAVTGATVMLAGEKPKTGNAWNEGMNEPELYSSQSDSDGNAPLSFYSRPYPNEASAGILLVLVKNPDGSYCCTEVNVEAVTPIKLTQGVRIEIEPKPIANLSFQNIIATIKTDSWPNDLKLPSLPNQPTVAVSLPFGNYRVSLTATKDQKTYQGDFVDLTVPLKNNNKGIIQIPIQAPNNIRGTLDVSVPRPVKNGWVKACVVLRKTGIDQFYSGDYSSRIMEDGSFTLDDLPPGKVEIIAGCDGYLSKSDHPVDEDGYVRGSQFFDVSPSHPITVPMERTGAIRLILQAPDGKPLENASVSFNPNQKFAHGTWNLGAMGSEYTAVTDASGVAIIKNLPAGCQLFYVNAHKYQLPMNRNMEERTGFAIIRSGVEETLKIKMDSLDAPDWQPGGWENYIENFLEYTFASPLMIAFFSSLPLFIGCVLAIFWPPINVKGFMRRASCVVIFFVCLLLAGDICNALWSIFIYGRFYEKIGYHGYDFSPLWSMRGVLLNGYGKDGAFNYHNHLKGIEMGQLEWLWFYFAIGTWILTILFYRWFCPLIISKNSEQVGKREWLCVILGVLWLLLPILFFVSIFMD